MPRPCPQVHPVTASRRTLAGMAVLGLLTALAPPADAEASRTGPTRVYDGTFCVAVTSALATVSRGAAEATGQVGHTGNDHGHCDRAYPKARHHVAQRMLLRFRPDPAGTEALCAATPWTYSAYRAATTELVATVDVARLCGPGQYRVETLGYVWNDERWHGEGGGPTEWLTLPGASA